MQIMYSTCCVFRALVTLLMIVETCAALKFNVTALSANKHRVSTIECWQMDTPFTVSTDAGIAGSASISLGNVTNLVYTVLPAGFDGGVHVAPKNQWVVFTKGLAVLTIPGDDSPKSTASIQGGGFGLIFAADTKEVSDKGHITRYPGITETVALQAPTHDGKVPNHKILYRGPCKAEQVAGQLGLATGKV
ncbi:hypothetical protein V8F20_005654 [Naviculisporaceae sp. PSN 640]